MGRAKDLIVKPISAKDANRIIKRLHYSGKVVQNSSLHFGVFLDGKCGGAMSFGSSLDKRKMLGLVKDTGWNEFIELNRMAFADWLPRFGESRCIGVAIRYIKKNYPQIKWIVSFSDGTQCGDGAIYRASGFALTSIKENATLYKFPSGDNIAGMTIEANWDLPIMKKQCDFLGIEHKQRTRTQWRKYGAKPLPGFQLRYIYFIDKTAKDRLTVPILPFSEIDKRGAGMYRGKSKQRASSETSDTADFQSDKGGATPTDALHTD